jgi:hypothetical protein
MLSARVEDDGGIQIGGVGNIGKLVVHVDSHGTYALGACCGSRSNVLNRRGHGRARCGAADCDSCKRTRRERQEENQEAVNPFHGGVPFLVKRSPRIPDAVTLRMMVLDWRDFVVGGRAARASDSRSVSRLGSVIEMQSCARKHMPG